MIAHASGRLPRLRQNYRLALPHPEGPCAEIVYTLALEYSLYRYIGPKVYSIWVHGPLGPLPSKKQHSMREVNPTVCEDQPRGNTGALIITYTTLGVPYYNYSIMGAEKLVKCRSY